MKFEDVQKPGVGVFVPAPCAFSKLWVGCPMSGNSNPSLGRIVDLPDMKSIEAVGFAPLHPPYFLAGAH